MPPHRRRSCPRRTEKFVTQIAGRDSRLSFEQPALRVDDLQQAADLFWIAALLQDEPYRRAVLRLVIDDASRDRRTVGRFRRCASIEGERQKIAVAGIVAAELLAEIRQRPIDVTALQQQLGRIDRARAYEDPCGIGLTCRGAGTMIDEVDAVTARPSARSAWPRIGL